MRTVVAIGAVALTLSCAGGPEPLELSPWSAEEGQSCRTSPPNAAVEAIVDTATLAGRVSGLEPPDGAILWTVMAHADRPADVRRLETTFPPQVTDLVEEALLGALRTDGGETGSARLVLRTEGGSVSELAVGATEHCRPGIRNGVELSRLLQELYDRTGREATAGIWVSIDTTGEPTGARLVRSSGYPEMDLALLEIGRQARFYPALTERRAVPVWISFELRLRALCGPPSDTTAFSLMDDPCFGDSGQE